MTPVFVTFPPAYARPPEKVVLAVHVGMPLSSASTWPAVPALVVARAEPLPYMREPAVKLVQPVPPPATESVPESVGVNVCVLDEPTMVIPAVRPLNEEVLVASVCVPPVCV